MAAGLGAGLERYLQVLRRRWWVLALITLVVVAVSGALVFKQAKLYEASSEVLVNRNSPAATLTQTQIPYIDSQTAARLLETQVQLAREPALASRVVARSDVSWTPRAFLDASSVTSKPNTDILVFSVRNAIPGIARRVATVYGAEFTRYRQELDTRELQAVATSVRNQLAPIDTPEGHATPLWNDLQDKLRQIETLLAVQTSSATVVRTAPKASQVEPRPVPTVGGGLLLGLLLGLGAVFLLESFDTRVRSSSEVGRELEVPLLGRIPPPPKEFVADKKLVMMEGSELDDAEAFTFVRTSVEFATRTGDTQVAMISSAIEGEGKSTTVANLAVAFARTGRRVILVDADLRRPNVANLFGLAEHAGGLSELIRSGGPATSSLVPIAVPATMETASPPPAGAGNGSLHVLPGGRSSHGMNVLAIQRVLDELRPLCDLILLDSPPLLQMGDAVALSATVDALILIARIDVVRRPMLEELRRILDATPVRVLGFVLTGTAEESGYGGYYRHSYAPHPEQAPAGDDTAVNEQAAPPLVPVAPPPPVPVAPPPPAPEVMEPTTSANGQGERPTAVEAGLSALLEMMRRRRANRG